MSSKDSRRLNAAGIIFLLCILVIVAVNAPIGTVRTSPRQPEANDVLVLTRTIIEYAERKSEFPLRLQDLNFSEIGHISLERFIYLAPVGAKATDLPATTPLVAFPWEDGAHIGYLRGNVRFHRAGYGERFPVRFERRLRLWQMAFALSLTVSMYLGYKALSRRRVGNDGAQE